MSGEGVTLCHLLAGAAKGACAGVGFTGGGAAAIAYDLHVCGDQSGADGGLGVSTSGAEVTLGQKRVESAITASLIWAE